MNKKIRLILFLFGLIFFLYFVFDFGLENIYINILKTGWWFLPIIATWGIVYLLNTFSLRIILGEIGRNIKLSILYRITLASFALNYATPFASLGGEAFRALALQERVGSRNAVSTVLLFRMVHSTAHFFFWLISIVMIALLISLSQRLRLALSFIFVIVVLFAWLFLSAQKYGIFGMAFKLLRAFPFLSGLKRKLQNREELLLDLDSKIRYLYNSRRGAFYGALSIEILSRFTSSFEFYFILRAIGYDVPIMYAFYISAATSIILNLFFFVPLELGTREGSLYLVMHTLNFTPGIGIYISLVNRIREFFWILVGLVLMQLMGGPGAKAESNPNDNS